MKSKLQHMDPIGCSVFIAAVCCLLLALQWGGQTKPWRSPTIIGLLVGGAALFCLFGIIQWKLGEKATIPLRILRYRSIYTSAGVLFFLGASTYVVIPTRNIPLI
jgi:fatty acid desaturase